MNNSSLDLQELESNLERLRGRVPDFPVSRVLLSRLILHLGRGMTGLLESGIRGSRLTEIEFRVLTMLFSHPDGSANPTDLCFKTAQSPANMSRISDTLVSRDLITRGASLLDRRKMVLRITEQGEDLVRRIMPDLYPPLDEIFGDLEDQALVQLIEQLRRLGAKMDQALAKHTLERLE